MLNWLFKKKIIGNQNLEAQVTSNLDIKTVVDELGFVFINKDKIYRAIINKDYELIYNDLLGSDYLDDLYTIGLVETKVSDFNLKGHPFVLEHRRIPFILSPSEYTDKMFWKAAKMMITLAEELSKHGFILKDAHPFNISYDGSKPIFFDFTSILKSDQIPSYWLKQFITYFAVPIYLASEKTTNKLALEYRREHITGLGIKFFSVDTIRNQFFGELLQVNNYKDNPADFFSKINSWLDAHPPYNLEKEYWASYEQGHATSYLNPKTIKQKFVYNTVLNEKPKTVLDMAGNKGYFAAMAASLGASVIAFDYEEFCVNECLALAEKESLDITPALMNFILPTPAHGWGLIEANAFKRFNSDIVLALGLIHHICLTQNVPVRLFCEICLKYAKNGIVLEYVDPTDKHLANWKRKTTMDYSLDKIAEYMKRKFPNVVYSDRFVEGGVNRIYAYYYL